LHPTYQALAAQKEELELRDLNVGRVYYFAIEAVNENGVSKTVMSYTVSKGCSFKYI